VVTSKEKHLVLSMLYNDYIKKDIIEILKIGKPDILEKMIALLAHSSGQLTNENQLSIDCKASNSLIQNYLDILENTYVISKLTPFVGNKRSEVTSRPKYYFIDNGFRNQALRNFLPIASRQDIGLLVEGAVFQELLKYRDQNYLNYHIHFWRTRSGAEVDFVLTNGDQILPIEIKYQNFNKLTISKSFRSFLSAYKPKVAIIISKDYKKDCMIDETLVKMIPLSSISFMFDCIGDWNTRSSNTS
jgi:predicted AAA+ superfamily ATPase